MSMTALNSVLHDSLASGTRAEVLLKAYGPAALHEAASHSGLHHRVLDLLVAGADPNVATSDGWTPLLAAISTIEYPTPGPQAVLALLVAGSDPNAGRDGSTPLHLAVDEEQNYPEAVFALLKAGANPNATDKQGWTPLHLAAAVDCSIDGGGDGVVVNMLLEAGADPNARTPEGLTPLDMSSSEAATRLLRAPFAAQLDASLPAAAAARPRQRV